MSKHLSAITKDCTTFGMEIDGTAARKVWKKTFFKDFLPYHDNPDIVITKRCINAADLAALMGPCAWLVSEKQSFKEVQLGDGEPWLRVVYPS